MSDAYTVWGVPDEWEQAELIGALRDVVAVAGPGPLGHPVVDALRSFETGDVGVLDVLRMALREAGLEGVPVEAVPEGLVPPGASERETELAACRFATTAWRVRHGLVLQDPELEERMCVVTAVYLGFGVIVANGADGRLPPGHVCFLLAVRSVVGAREGRLGGEIHWIQELLAPIQEGHYRRLLRELRDCGPRLREILQVPEPSVVERHIEPVLRVPCAPAIPRLRLSPLWRNPDLSRKELPMTSLVPILLTAALGASAPSARLEPHDGALWYTHCILPAGSEPALKLTLASSSDLPVSGLFGGGMGITEETTITVLPGGALHLVDPGPCPACSVVVAEPSPEVLATSVAAAAATLRSSGVSALAPEAEAYARRLQDDSAFREAEWRRQNKAWLAAAAAETSGGVARLPVGAHYRAVALPSGFLRYSAPTEVQEFDAHGRLVRIVSPGGLEREIDRDEDGRIRRIVDAAGHSISFERDASGRAVRALAGNGKDARFGYDSAGRLAWSEGSDGRLEYAWGDGGQLTAVTGPGVEIRATYLPPSQGGKLASLSTDEGSTERYSYERHADGLVQVTEVHDEWRDGLHPIPTGKVEPWMRSEAPASRRFTYVEPLGNDGRRFVWQQTVEEDDETRVTIHDQRTFRPIAISSGSSTTEFRYDDFGRVVERRTAGSVTLVEYAPGGRVSRVVRRDSHGEEDGESVFEANFRYDARGDLAEGSDTYGRRVSMEYDERRQIRELTVQIEDDEAPRHLLITRNDTGRIIRIEAVGVGAIDVTYDEDGAIDEVKSSGPGVALAVTGSMSAMLDVVRAGNVGTGM